jgi:uncharacterized membrane protein
MRRARRLDVTVGYVLLGGVLTSVTLIAAGVVWRRFVTGDFGFDYQLAGTTVFQFIVTDVEQLLAGVLRPRLLVNLGIAVLMLTPYIRVLASMVYFAVVERNWKYTCFTAFVLATLTYSLFLR